MNVVVKSVNYIQSHSLKRCEFKNFLAEIDIAYLDVEYDCWLSRVKVLEKFFELCTQVEIFMIEQGYPVPELVSVLVMEVLTFLVN